MSFPLLCSLISAARGRAARPCFVWEREANGTERLPPDRGRRPPKGADEVEAVRQQVHFPRARCKAAAFLGVGRPSAHIPPGRTVRSYAVCCYT